MIVHRVCHVAKNVEPAIWGTGIRTKADGDPCVDQFRHRASAAGRYDDRRVVYDRSPGDSECFEEIDEINYPNAVKRLQRCVHDLIL